MTALEPPAGSSAQLWLMLAVTMAVQVLATFTTLSLAAIAPDVAAGLNASPELVGFQVSLLYCGAALMSTIAGFQLRRWGPIRVSQASLAFCAVGAALAAVPSLATIALGSLIIGFGYGMTNPAASQLLLRLTPSGRRNLVLSVKQTGVPIGGVLAGLAAPAVSQSVGWQGAPALAALSCLALAVAMQPLRRPHDAGRNPGAPFGERTFDSLSLVWQSPSLRWLSLNGFCYAAVQLSLATFTVTLLVTEAGFGLIAAGVVLAVVQAAGIAGRIAWGWVADRFGRGQLALVIMGAACLAGALSVMAVSADWGRPAITLVFALFGFNALGWTGVFQVEAVRHAPAGQAGAVVGGITASAYAGVIVGPAAFSLVFAITGAYTTTFGLVALFAAVGIVSLVLVRRTASRPDGALP